MKPHRRCGPCTRRGASSLELQVAFVVFSMSLVGVAPLAHHATSWSAQLDSQLKPYDAQNKSGTSFYLQPTTTPWAAKLGVAASASTTPPEPSPRTLIDDGGSQYFEALTGNEWVPWPVGYHGTSRRYEASATASNANWEFTGLPPGRYTVYMTWPKASELASDASVKLYYPIGSQQQVVTLNQTKDPIGPQYDSATWQALGQVVTTSDGYIRVQLDTSSTAPVLADAVRVVPTPRSVSVASYGFDAQHHVALQARVQ